MKPGFDNDKYLKMQSTHIMERIAQFDNKLYLEFGGKLFDDFHASRVLPGFAADSKLQMLMQLADQAEIVMVVSAEDIDKNKVREDLGITYDKDVIRLMDEFRSRGLYVGSVVLTKYAKQRSVVAFQQRLEQLGIKVYRHYLIPGYPANVPLIVSEDGYGKNDYIETTRPLVVVTAPGPGSGKMSVCLSQLYHELKHGVRAGYAKFETFPIWNLPLDHPVNLAYEAATADLNDINMIDPYHLKAYGITTVNYNRDVEIYPVLNAIFMKIYGSSPYASPTDMGVNMVGNCIFDDEACREASRQEIIRRYYQAVAGLAEGSRSAEEVNKIQLLMSQENLELTDRKVVSYALERARATGAPATAIELPDGQIITGKTGDLLGPSAAAVMNAIKVLAGIPHKELILSPESIAPIQALKTQYLGSKNPRLHIDEVLIALSATAANNEAAALALSQLPKLKGCQVHSSVRLSAVDKRMFKKLECDLTCEPKSE
ncbi:MAG: DUF1846 domain-containing protein [Lachnospiraceae bacterium]|nr:DUF1846 domain-containing protein [Lachnospiraceae bacterium]